ncbi:MAG: 1-acyl-sn-glycerol-3-phosphate acyltransferase [Verrucomicrobiota bacterium]
MDRLPKNGGVLMIANHVSYIDWLVLSLACPRPIRFILNERFVNMPIAGWFTRLFSSLPVDPRRTRAVIRKTCEAISNGDIVCIFPEGQLSRSGVMNELIKGFTLIASQAKAPIQPVYIDSMWGSVFSFERNRFFKKRPLHLRYPVTINLGELIPYENASPEAAREALLALSAESLGNRPEIKQPLDRALVSALKKRPGAVCLIEQGKKKHALKREQILGLSIALSRYWKTSLADTSDKVAVFLPPGAAPTYINLGLMIAGKTPVNLPFQHQPDLDQLAAKLDQHGITTLITSRAFFPQLEALLQSEKPAYHLLDMRSEIDAASGIRVMMERLLARFEPLWSTLKRLELEDGSDKQQQASFAFVPQVYPALSTSSAKSPKTDFGETIFLSASNILAQVHQLRSINFLTTGETIFSESPLNTIEGAMFSLFLPVFSHTAAAMRSFGRQTQGDSIESILRESSASSILLTAKLRQQILAEESWHPQLKKQIRQFLSFQLPPDTSNLTLADHTGTPVLQAYAPTDLGRILAVSMVNPPRGSAVSLEQHGNLPNAVGRLLPGIAASHTETWNLQSPTLSDQKKRYPLPTGSHIDKEGFVFLDTEDT